MRPHLFGILLLALLAGCSPPKHDGILIGFSMDTLKEERWQKDKKLFLEHAEKLGAKVILQAANGDDAVQLAQAENMLTQGVDVLVVVPHNGATAARIVQAAQEEGVKTISYERLIRDVDVDLLVSVDAVKVGEVQAQYAVSKLPKGRYMLLGGGPTDNNAHLVRKGQLNVLKPYVDRGDITIVADAWANEWLPSEALRHTENALTAQQNRIDAVIASNDGTAGGAIQALEQQGLASKVLVTGQDAELAACQRILNGSQTMTVFKSVRNTAYTAVEAAIALAKGEPVPTQTTVDNGYAAIPAILIPPEAVDRNNLESLILGEGYHTQAALFGKEHP